MTVRGRHDRYSLKSFLFGAARRATFRTTNRLAYSGQILTGGHMAFPKTLCRSAVTVLAFVACERAPQQATAPTAPQFSRTAATEQDPALLRHVQQINQQLAANGQHVAIEALDFFTIGNGRPGTRPWPPFSSSTTGCMNRGRSCPARRSLLWLPAPQPRCWCGCARAS